jgi:hypothetical protein
MDIISYQKAMKSKKAMKSLNDRLGDGVQDIHPNVKTRLEELEKKDPKVDLYNRVSDMEANTAINLNKHNLHMNTVLNKNRFGLTDLAFDDFGDDTGIDAAKSHGHSFDAVGRKMKIASGQVNAELVTTPEELAAVPQMITVSQAFNEITSGERMLNFTAGFHTNTIGEEVSGEFGLEWDSENDTVSWIYSEGNGSKLTLHPKEDGTFYEAGEWESDILSFGEVKSLYRMELQKSDEEKVKVYTSTSEDGIDYSEYVPLNPDGTIGSPGGSCLKVKVQLFADGTASERELHTFDAEEVANFESNDFIVMDGSAKLKTQFTLSSTPVSGWTEQGTVLSFTLDKTKFKSFEIMEVQ